MRIGVKTCLVKDSNDGKYFASSLFDLLKQDNNDKELTIKNFA